LLQQLFGRQAVATGGLVIAGQAVQEGPFVAGLRLLGVGFHHAIAAVERFLQAFDLHLPQAIS
jgi:hypothetical protein